MSFEEFSKAYSKTKKLEAMGYRAKNPIKTYQDQLKVLGDDTVKGRLSVTQAAGSFGVGRHLLRVGVPLAASAGVVAYLVNRKRQGKGVS